MSQVMVEQRLVEHLRGEIAELEQECARLREVARQQADRIASLQRPLNVDSMRAVREGRLI